MKNNKEMKNIIIFVIILFVFSGVYLLLDYIFNNENAEAGEILKNYKVNEYIPTYVSDEDMAKIYLNDYIFKMFSNPAEAYELLDKEYKDKKFGNYDNFKKHIYSLNYTSFTMDRYFVKTKKGYNIYGVYDTNGNLFIFRTNGVMQYKVYLDDYTVEI